MLYPVRLHVLNFCAIAQHHLVELGTFLDGPIQPLCTCRHVGYHIHARLETATQSLYHDFTHDGTLCIREDCTHEVGSRNGRVPHFSIAGYLDIAHGIAAVTGIGRCKAAFSGLQLIVVSHPTGCLDVGIQQYRSLRASGFRCLAAEAAVVFLVQEVGDTLVPVMGFYHHHVAFRAVKFGGTTVGQFLGIGIVSAVFVV